MGVATEKLTKATMKRLKGFDYTKPYFYMVTLKRVKGLKPFCEITKEKDPSEDAQGWPCYLIANEITEAFLRVISGFHEKWRGLWSSECFIVMPDHLHLLIHIKDMGDQMALGKYVYQLMKAVKGHRTTQPGSFEWNALVDECARIGPGGAGVGTFMSSLKKACGNVIAAAGGKWVVLSPEGIHERWHPGRQYEKYCAEGRMFFLSLYPVLDRLPTKSELYQRCHEMGDIVMAGLN